jgi:hypothetical protein
VHYKIGVPRRGTYNVRNCRLSGSAAFWTIESQGNSGLGRHSHSMGQRVPLVQAEFYSRCPMFVLGGRLLPKS